MANNPKPFPTDLSLRVIVPQFVHYHDCEWCGLPYDCGNGVDCDLSKKHGYCSQECFDHKRGK